jgi:hypothetical protein
MRPTLFLRIAAVSTFIHAALHTIGGVFGKPSPGPATVAAEAMKMNRFLLMGHTRNYWDFYRGLGLGVTVFSWPRRSSSGNWGRWQRRTRVGCGRFCLRFWLHISRWR